MTEQFARSLLKVAVAQICQNVGWHAVQTTPCELLTDVLHRYLEEIAKQTHRYTAQFGRTIPNVDDLALSFKDINIPLGELEEYVTQVEPVPFAHEIPAFPVYHSNNFQHPKPGSKELLRRPEWIHDHLPALYLETDDIESTPSPAPTELPQSTTPKRLSSEITSCDGSLGPVKRQLDSPSDSSVPSKRPRLTSDEENCIPREMTSVVMTASGLLSPTREGKLPEAKTPSKIKSLNEESNSSCESPRGLMKDFKKGIEHINGILPNKTKDSSEKDKNKSSGTTGKPKSKIKHNIKPNSLKPKVKRKSQSSIRPIKSKNSKVGKTTKSSKDLIRTPKVKSFKSLSQVVSPLQLVLSRCDKVKVEKSVKAEKNTKIGKSFHLDKLKLDEMKKESKKDDCMNLAFIKLEKIPDKVLIKAEILDAPSRDDSPEPRLVIDDDPNRQSEHEKQIRLANLDLSIDAAIQRGIAEVEIEHVQMEDTIETVARGPPASENDIDKSDSSLPKTPTISPPPTPTVATPIIKIRKQKSPKDSSLIKERKRKPKEKSPKEKLPKVKLPKDKAKDKNKEKLCKEKPDDKNKKIREKIKEKIQSKSGLKQSTMHPLSADMREESFIQSLMPGAHSGLSQPSISPSLSAPPTPRTPQSPGIMPFTSPQMSRGIFSLPTSPHFPQYPFYQQHHYPFYSNVPAQNFQSPPQNFPSFTTAPWLAPLAQQVRYRSISSPERGSPARSPPVAPKLGVGVSPTLQTLTIKSPSVSPLPTLTLDGDRENFEDKEKVKTRDKPPKKKHIKIVNNLRWSGKHLTAKRKEHRKDKKKDKNKDKDKDLPKPKKKKDKDKEKDRSKEKEKQKEQKESEPEKLSKVKSMKEKPVDKEKEKDKDREKEKDHDKEKEKEKVKIKDKKETKEKKDKKEGKEKDKHKSSKDSPPGATGSANPSIPKITVKFGGGGLTPDVPKIVIKPVLPPESTLLKPPSPVRVPSPLLAKPPTPKPQTKNVASPPIPPKGNPSISQPPRSSTPVQRTVITETVGAIVDEGGQKIWICPACTRPDDGSPMIGCDDCDDWYHWVCIGIVEAPDEEENWYCPRCQLKKKEQKKKKKKRHRSSHDYN